MYEYHADDTNNAQLAHIQWPCDNEYYDTFRCQLDETSDCAILRSALFDDASHDIGNGFVCQNTTPLLLLPPTSTEGYLSDTESTSRMTDADSGTVVDDTVLDDEECEGDPSKKKLLEDCFNLHHHVACECPQCVVPLQDARLVVTNDALPTRVTPHIEGEDSAGTVSLPLNNVQTQKSENARVTTLSEEVPPNLKKRKVPDLSWPEDEEKSRLSMEETEARTSSDWLLSTATTGATTSHCEAQLPQFDVTLTYDDGPYHYSPKKRPARGKSPPSVESPTRMAIQHNGPLFAPPYKPHGAPLLYKGVPIKLTPAAEEAAVLFSRLPRNRMDSLFKDNFFHDFTHLLHASKLAHMTRSAALACTAQHQSKYDVAHFDFGLIKAATLQKEAAERRATKRTGKPSILEIQKRVHAHATVNGKVREVMRYEIKGMQIIPSGPLRGRIQRRVTPEDVTLNLPCGEDHLEHALEVARKHKWANIICDPHMTWTAFWKEPVTNQLRWSWVNTTGDDNDDEYNAVSHEVFRAALTKRHLSLVLEDDNSASEVGSNEPAFQEAFPFLTSGDRHSFFDWVGSAAFVDGVRAMRQDVEVRALSTIPSAYENLASMYFRQHALELKRLKVAMAAWMVDKFGFCVNARPNMAEGAPICCLHLPASCVILSKASKQLEIRVPGADPNSITIFRHSERQCEYVYKMIYVLRCVAATCHQSVDDGGELASPPHSASPLLFNGISEDDLNNYILSFLPGHALTLSSPMDMGYVIRTSNRNVMLAGLLSTYSSSRSFESLKVPCIMGASFKKTTDAKILATRALGAITYECMSSFYGHKTYTHAMMDNSPTFSQTSTKLRRAVKICYGRSPRLVCNESSQTGRTIGSAKHQKLVSDIALIFMTVCHSRIRLMNPHNISLRHPWIELDDRALMAFIKQHNLSVQLILPLLGQL